MARTSGGIRIPIITEFDDRAIKKFGQSTEALGKDLTKKLTLPILGLGAASVKAFSDFESSMVQSFAIMGNVSDDLKDQMTASAREIATQLGMSHKEVAESYYFLASAGLDAEQSIAALPQVAMFAKAGMFDMALATDLATDAQSALGLTVKDSQQNLTNLKRVTDVLVGANTLANASVEQFSSSLTNKAGAAMKVLNMDIEEGVAVLAAFADQGVKGEFAGTQFSIVLRDLQTKALANKQAFAAMNIEVFDSQGNFNNFADILSDMETALDGMSDAQRRATLTQLGFSDKSLGALQTLLGTSDAIRDYETNLRSMAGMTEEVANKQLESFASQMAIVKAEIVDLAIDFGPILIDRFLKPLIETVRNTVERFKNLTDAQKNTIVTVLAIVAAFGPLLIIVGKIIIGVAKLRAAMVLLNLTLAANPIGLLVIAIGLLVTGFVVLYKSSETFRNGLKSLGNMGIWFAESVVNLIIAYLNSWVGGINLIIRGLNSLGMDIKEVGSIGSVEFNRLSTSSYKYQQNVAGMSDYTKELAGISTKQLEPALDGVAESLDDVSVSAGGAGAALDKKTKSASKAKDEIKKLQDALIKMRQDAVDKLKGSLREAESQLETAQRKFKAFKDSVAGSISGIIDFGKAADNDDFMVGLNEQANAATSFADKVKQLIQLGLSEKAIQQVLKTGFEAGNKIADQIIAGGSTVVNQVNTLVDSVDQIAEQVGDMGARQFYLAGVQQGESLVNGILDALRAAQAELLAAQTAAARGGAIANIGGTLQQALRQEAISSGNKKALDLINKVTQGGAGKVSANELKRIQAAGVGAGLTHPSARLAKGGIVLGPTNALIGEAGPEAVVPLSGANSAKMGNTFNITVNAGMGANGNVIGQEIVEAIKRYERSSGPVFARA